MKRGIWNGVKQSACSISVRNAVNKIIALALMVATVLMIMKSIILITGCESPVVILLTGSMEPGFKRGDILFLNMKNTPFQAGEIVVFKTKGKDSKEIPIVHRVIKVHRRRNSDQVNLLTKGDNNSKDDRYKIYEDGQRWLENNQIIGRVKGYLPYIGYPIVLITEKPLIKYLVAGGLSIWQLLPTSLRYNELS